VTRFVSADVVEAALSEMIEVAMDRTNMPAVRLSILKRRLVELQNHIDQQASAPTDGEKRAFVEAWRVLPVDRRAL